MDSWGVGVGVCGSLMDGGKERGGATISWWSAWGERCVIGLWGLEAEAIGGAGGRRRDEHERENGRCKWGQGEKG